MREATKEERESINNYIKSISQKVITIPDEATNGDVIRALFYVKNVEELGCCTFASIAGDSDMRVYKDWWNAPYKGE